MRAFWRIEEVTREGARTARFYECNSEAIVDPLQRYPLELAIQLHDDHRRTMLRFRSLFKASTEQNFLAMDPSDVIPQLIDIVGYYEDEDQQPISLHEMMRRSFRIPKDGLVFHSSHRSHDVQLSLALANGEDLFAPVEKPLSLPNLALLTQFIRDAEILRTSRLIRQQSAFTLNFVDHDGAGTLKSIDSEAITHFVITYRRLTADDEPANFGKVCNTLFLCAPKAQATIWMGQQRKSFNRELSQKVDHIAVRKFHPSFTNAQLIRSFINGDLAHPGTDDDRTIRATFASEVGGEDTLKFLFLTQIRAMALTLINSARLIRGFLPKEPRDRVPDDRTSFRDPEAALPPEQYLRKENQQIFERSVSQFAEHLMIADVQRTSSLHDHLCVARHLLREVLK